MRVIADRDRGRDNNYHILRLVGAALVIVGHSYHLTASADSEPLRAWTGYKGTHEFGVLMFFVISGYLVTKSFLSRGDLPNYLEARILRIGSRRRRSCVAPAAPTWACTRSTHSSAARYPR
jgi:peptidoglycan/LPS O-acetylase OafA/YrhL